MQRDSKSGRHGKGSLEELMRERVQRTIELIVEQELEEALGAASSARVGERRTGYRHGHRQRTLSTSLGAATIALPRAAMTAGGTNGAARSVRAISAGPNGWTRRFWEYI